jgi:uncharacterized protein
MGFTTTLMPAPALAISASGLPPAAPKERIIDTADVLSRAAIGELSKTLESFSAERVDAHLITVNRLDYGLSLPQFCNKVLERWSESGSEPNQVLFLIDSQTNSTAVVTSPGLVTQLDTSLLRSTARTTMALPIRDGSRASRSGTHTHARARGRRASRSKPDKAREEGGPDKPSRVQCSTHPALT